MDRTELERYFTLGTTLRVVFEDVAGNPSQTVVGRVFRVEERAAQFEYLEPDRADKRYIRIAIDQILDVTDVTNERL